jgi:hypothetical protein
VAAFDKDDVESGALGLKRGRAADPHDASNLGLESWRRGDEEGWRWVEEIIEPGLHAMMKSARWRTTTLPLQFRNRSYDGRGRSELCVQAPAVELLRC